MVLDSWEEAEAQCARKAVHVALETNGDIPIRIITAIDFQALADYGRKCRK